MGGMCVLCTDAADHATPRCAASTHPSSQRHSMLHVSAGFQLTRSCKCGSMYVFSRLLGGPCTRLQVSHPSKRSSKAVAVAWQPPAHLLQQAAPRGPRCGGGVKQLPHIGSSLLLGAHCCAALHSLCVPCAQVLRSLERQGLHLHWAAGVPGGRPCLPLDRWGCCAGQAAAQYQIHQREDTLGSAWTASLCLSGAQMLQLTEKT